MQADFEFEVVAGSPLLGLGIGLNVGDIIPFQALGVMTFELDDSGGPGATSMAFTNVTGVLDGVSPAGFLPFSISPNVSFEGGSLDSIVRDLGGNITSAFVNDLRMFWRMDSTAPVLGGAASLYSDTPLSFSGNVTGIGFNLGDMLANATEFDLYLGDPENPQGTDPFTAIGRNRTLTAVPEPGSLAVLALGACAAAYRRRKTK